MWTIFPKNFFLCISVRFPPKIRALVGGEMFFGKKNIFPFQKILPWEKLWFKGGPQKGKTKNPPGGDHLKFKNKIPKLNQNFFAKKSMKFNCRFTKS